MIVIYVEKKAVAKCIASALNAPNFSAEKDLTKQKLGILGYWSFFWNKEETYIIYGVGHLTTLCNAKEYDSKFETWALNSFPCIPKRFRTVPIQKSIDFYNQAYKLFQKADLIISATDSDREGQVVFEYLYKTVGVQTPWKRAWLPSDLTPAKIRQAFDNLEDWQTHYPLTLAGMVRSISDWLIGCNLTVAATLKYGGNTIMNVGRVQTTVLGIVVKRSREIETFEPRSFWKVSIDIHVSEEESFTAHLIEPKQFSSKQEADIILNLLSADAATVVNKTVLRRVVKKPLLFSTTELQIAINKKYGYAVTDIANDMEFLYNNRFISYPRTGAVVLSNAQEKDTTNSIKKLFSTNEYKKYFRIESSWAPFTSRHFNDIIISKTEDSHTAVTITGIIPDLSTLSTAQQHIYDMIARSILSLAYDDVVIEDTCLEFEISGYRFKATGSVVQNPDSSWYRVVEHDSGYDLPELNIGDCLPFEAFVREGKTKPKPYYTQATLLKAMTYPDSIVDDDDVAKFMKASDCGLGTGATRPEIIGGLLKNGFLQLNKKHLIPTSKGYWLIDHIPDDLRMIKDPATTGRWEQSLNKIAISDLAAAKDLSAKFLNKIYEATATYYNIIVNSPTALFGDTNEGKVLSGEAYSCPKCGKPLRRFNWGFGCMGRKDGCQFAIGKFRGKQLTEKQMSDLLISGKTGKITLKSKAGKKYQGFLSLDENNDIKFNFLTKGVNNGTF